MRSFRIFDRRVGSIIAVAALLFAAVMPSMVFAAQATTRSIALSSSSADADDVTYDVKFTPATSGAGAVVIEFCSNSPLLADDCTPPDAGFDASGATTTSANFTMGTKTTNKVILTVSPTLSAGTATEIVLDHINNPTAAGALYARIATYDNATDAGNKYPSMEATDGYKDNGSVAMSITPTIGVSGAVLESMTFCVSGETIAAGCAGGGAHAPSLTAPTLRLGQDLGNGVVALSSTLSEGSIYTQLSTNAVSGAVVRLKSSATNCGGLKLVGSSDASNCYIHPALQTGVATNDTTAKFGVETTTAAGVGTSSGTLRPYDDGTGAYYGNSAYALNGAADNLTGVTSQYGDPFLDTNSAPVNNMGMQLKFGAVVTSETPAGLYSADLSLIATGKF